jgi:hypothetical protein
MGPCLRGMGWSTGGLEPVTPVTDRMQMPTSTPEQHMREDTAGVTNIQRNERTGYYEMCRRIPIGQHISGIIVVRAAHQRRHPVARDRQAQRTSTTEKKVLASALSAESTKLNWGLATPLAAKTSEPETGQETSKTQVKLLLLTYTKFLLLVFSELGTNHII